MKPTRIPWEKLLRIVKTNRENHIEALKISFKGWRDETLTQALHIANTAEAVMGEKQTSIDMIQREVAKLDKPPVSHLRDYDRLIKMIELTDEEHIELTEQEFDQYVNDEWSWKQNFMLSNSKYGAFVE